MSIDLQAIKESLPSMVPMVGTLDLAFIELTADSAIMKLPDQPAFRNHLGGPHAGAMFTLGESASGALVLANFADRLESVVPLAVSAEIRYQSVAMGEVVAEARMLATPVDVLKSLDEGERPEFEIHIGFTSSGRDTGHMSVTWTLKPVNP
jgi:acyl-coenzyme A thioesterase PaaI-like protein